MCSATLAAGCEFRALEQNAVKKREDPLRAHSIQACLVRQSSDKKGAQVPMLGLARKLRACKTNPKPSALFPKL